MQGLSDFALPCTVTQVLNNGPMSISREGDLSGQTFKLGWEVSCLATCRESRQTATVLRNWDYKHGECCPNRRGPRRVSEKRMRSRADRPRGQVVPLHRIYRHSAVGRGVRGFEDRWCATVGRHFWRPVGEARLATRMRRHPIAAAWREDSAASQLGLREKLIDQSWRAS